MRRVLLIVVALGLALPAGAGAATKSTVTIDGIVPFHTMYGVVKSPKRSCKNHRKVTLYKKDAGPDTKIGSDKAQPGMDNSYQWQVEQGKYEAGRYYAKIVHEHGCEGDTSKIFALV